MTRGKAWAAINDVSVFVLSGGGSVLRAFLEMGVSVSVLAPAIALGWFAVGLWEYAAPIVMKKVNHKGRRSNVVRFFLAPVIGWFSADIISLVQRWAEARIMGG